MLTSVEFFCGLLIGLILGLSLHYKTYNQLDNISQKLEAIIRMIEPGNFKVKSKSTKLLSERKYLENIENLWKDFKKLLTKNLIRTQLSRLRKWQLKSTHYVKEKALLPQL